MNAQAQVTRSGARSVVASHLLVRLEGRAAASTKAWSLFTRKERCSGEVAHEAVRRTARQWQRTVQQGKDVASCRHDNPSLLRYSGHRQKVFRSFLQLIVVQHRLSITYSQ